MERRPVLHNQSIVAQQYTGGGPTGIVMQSCRYIDRRQTIHYNGTITQSPGVHRVYVHRSTSHFLYSPVSAVVPNGSGTVSDGATHTPTDDETDGNSHGTTKGNGSACTHVIDSRTARQAANRIVTCMMQLIKKRRTWRAAGCIEQPLAILGGRVEKCCTAQP